MRRRSISRPNTPPTPWIWPAMELFVAVPLLFVGIGLIAYGTVGAISRVVTATSSSG